MTDPLRDLLDLYEGPASRRRYDEHVSELEHALQCADLALADGADDALVVAALFHDIGHLLAGGAATTTAEAADGGISLPGADDRHELTGARYLRRRFGPEVAAPVALHVDAKRYLVTTDPDYAALLSESSVHSLSLQGGPLPVECVSSFRSRPRWVEAVELRRFDDAAKVAGRSTSSLDDHVDRIRTLLR